ncbi:MAG: hypothetical protein K2J58_04510 [Muribaculaceae bacterium]|nr:hypothetical protein [Muribaculaceae bacterium]
MTTLYRHLHRVSLIPAMRSEARGHQSTLLHIVSGHNHSASPLRLCVRFLLSALLIILLPACRGDNGPNGPDDPGFETGIPTEVAFSLSSRSGNYTRADDGSPKSPNEDVEYIHDWWIAFVDINGNVTILEREEAKEKSHAGISKFEQETFKTVIPSGTYDIYAFANIDVPEDPESFIEGLLDATANKITDKALSVLVKNSEFVQSGMQWPSDKNIPMTGFINGAKIRNNIEESFSIEVIRTVAKVEFTIENPTEDEISLESVMFDQVTKTDVDLFPDYSAIGQKAFTALDDADYGTLTIDTDLDKTPFTNTSRIFSFYCKETLGTTYEDHDDEAGCFKISFKGKRKRKGTDTDTSTTEDINRVFYTTKIKNYINRNDWVPFKITFNDWTIYWKLRAYPPIGGYPPVFDQNEDGTSLSARVATGGEFELYPYLIKKGGETYYEEGKEDNIDWSKEIALTVIEDSNDILMKDSNGKDVLSVDATNKVISGELDPYKIGTAKVQINFYLDRSTGITSELTCIFTINRN